MSVALKNHSVETSPQRSLSQRRPNGFPRHRTSHRRRRDVTQPVASRKRGTLERAGQRIMGVRPHMTAVVHRLLVRPMKTHALHNTTERESRNV